MNILKSIDSRISVIAILVGEPEIQKLEKSGRRVAEF